jgi:rubrerythrin
MGRMGAEDPSTAFRRRLLDLVTFQLMLLICSASCGGRLFRALFAEVELDSGGAYMDFRVSQPGYVCLNCGAPAFDLGEVPGEMAAEAEADEVPAATDILCPMCETLVRVEADMECPNCGAPLEVG